MMAIDVRLDRSTARHNLDSRLIAECAAEIDADTDRVIVSRFDRFGFSGARLYLIRCGSDSARPFVVKINSTSILRDEFASTRSVRSVFDVDATVQTESDGEFDQCAIAYPVVSATEMAAEVDIVELGDRLFELDDTIALDALESLYGGRFRFAHADIELQESTISDLFGRYLRREIADQRIDEIFGDDRSISGVLGEVAHPAELLSGVDRRREFHVSAIHGDLHAQNVVLDWERNAHMIDFGWAESQGPMLVDFTVMEATVRLMRFPRHVKPATFVEFQRALNRSEGHLRAREIVSRRSEPGAAMYGRAADLVGVIRAAAERACGPTWDYSEYQAALFATLYGMLAYSSYPVNYTLDVLADLADEITR